jgi:hypothetical protein
MRPLAVNVTVLLLFIILTFFSYGNLITPWMISNDDLGSHVVRLVEFDKALRDGHFPVRWSGRVNFGLGYPFLVFNYPLVYYLAETVYKTGFEFHNSMKFLLAASYPLSGFFAFFWLRQRFVLASSLAGGFIYTITPYHFVNVYIRGAMGEVLAITMIPLGFYILEKFIKNPGFFYTAILSLITASVIQFHSVITVYYFILLTGYFFVINQELKKLKRTILFFLSMFLGFALSAYYLLPAYFYKPLVALDSLKENFLKGAVFPDLKNLIYSKWGFGGPEQNFGQGEMSLQLGIVQQLAVLSGSILLLFKVRQNKSKDFRTGLFWVTVFLIAVFMMLEASFPVWKFIPPLQYQEFPWRILSVTPLPAAFLGAFVLDHFSNKIRGRTVLLLSLLVIVLVLFFNRNYAQPESFYRWDHPFRDDDVIAGTLTYRNEHLPYWHSKSEEVLPYYSNKVVLGEAEVIPIGRKTNLHTFKIKVLRNAVIADRTDYFPGWVAYANGKEIETLNPEDPLANGLIAFRLDPGEYFVEIKMEETPLEKAADAITVFSLFLTLVFLGLGLRKTVL